MTPLCCLQITGNVECNECRNWSQADCVLDEQARSSMTKHDLNEWKSRCHSLPWQQSVYLPSHLSVEAIMVRSMK